MQFLICPWHHRQCILKFLLQLAQSLGLEEDDLEDAFITLLDAEEVVPPPPKPTQSTSAAKVSLAFFIVQKVGFGVSNYVR